MKVISDPYLADVPQRSHYRRHEGYVVKAIGGGGLEDDVAGVPRAIQLAEPQASSFKVQ